MEISAAVKPSVVSVKVYKSRGVLELYGDGELIGRTRCIVGRDKGHKQKEGDYRTPEGEYYVVTRNDKSQYTLFFGLNYPNERDAVQGRDAGLIDDAQYEKIVQAAKGGEAPPWDTDMGGWIGIHGNGEGRPDTQGCIAVPDKDILVIGKYLKIGSKVEIFE